MRFSISNLVRYLNQNSIVRNPLIWVLGCTLMVLLLQLGANFRLNAPSQTPLPVYKTLDQIPKSAQQVNTGVYAMNLYDLNPSSNTYYLDFYIWFKWKPQGDLDPLKNLEFANGVEDWSLTQTNTYEKPEKLPDGSLYQIIRAKGRFRESFEFNRYPLDQQKLGITLENSQYNVNQVVYLGNTEESGYAHDLSVPGWKIKNYQLKNLVHEYGTNFGDPRDKPNESNYSALRYELLSYRPVSFFIWKLLLPLLIVLFSSWGALLLYPLYVDSRIILPITALLTTVFLQKSYADSLPDVGYLVLLDKIYALAYILIISSILESIITADWVKSEEPEAIARAKKLDRYVLIGNCTVLIGGVGLLLLL